MNRLGIAVVLFALGWPALLSASADLKDIDRTIVKEPGYTSRPHYGLLAFGPDAKIRVWLVLDGHVLYVDRNGNGDLTETNERVEIDVDTAKTIGRAPGEFKKTKVFSIGETAGHRFRLEVWVRDDRYVPAANEHDRPKKQRDDRKRYGWEEATLWRLNSEGIESPLVLLLCPNPKDAQVAHFDGPHTFALKSLPTFVRRSPAGVLSVCVGTVGLPARHSDLGSCASLVCTPSVVSEIPVNVHPIATIEFPHKDPGRGPIKSEVTLDQRC